MTVGRTMTMEVRFPRYQAMLSVYDDRVPDHPWQDISVVEAYLRERKVVDRVPVFVWPVPTQSGYFIVERRDGSCTYAHPSDLIFLNSEELFDQYAWEEA